MAITRQIATKELTGTLRVVSGLHIGAGSDVIEIGGMDNPIMKHPVTGAPYIPGSSLKGKLRSIMEWRLVPEQIIHNAGKPCNCGDASCPICTVFGTTAGNDKDFKKALDRGPTRVTVRDCFLSAAWQTKFDKGESLVEAKSENSINRITAKAYPRPLERVVPGVEFDFGIAFRVFARDDEETPGQRDEGYLNSVVLAGLAYLTQDALGGGGSRGNGRIEFADLACNGQSISLPEV